MSELSQGKSLAIGAAAGGVVFTVLFAVWLKTNIAGIQAEVAPSGRTIAEEAVKSYLANRVGLTSERLQQVGATVRAVQRLTGGR